MRYRVNQYLCSVLLMVTLLSSRGTAQRQTEFVFTHVTILPMTQDVILKDCNVLVRNGTIREITASSSATIPAGAEVIDAAGKFMIPALSDMHVHLEGDAWNIMFPPGAKFKAEEINLEDILFLYTAYGITTAEVMSALPEHIPLREKIGRNEIIGPRLILSRMIDGPEKAWPPPICTWVGNPEEAKRAVLESYRQGYDRMKPYSFLDKASYDTIIATAGGLKMPVDGHIPFATSVEHVLSSGQNMIAHVEEVMKFAKSFTPDQVHYYASLIAKSKTWVTSALILNRNLNSLLKDSADQFSKPGTEMLHPMASGIWRFVYGHNYRPLSQKDRQYLANAYGQFQKPFVKEFYSLGGKLLIGTDSPIPSTIPGISLHEELGELVASGLTPFEALKVATVNTHEFLGDINQSGTIEAGKRADFVLLDANPLEDISNTRKIRGVMTQGRWLPKEFIDTRLGEIRESYARLAKAKLN
jgi:hypothetical protein